MIEVQPIIQRREDRKIATTNITNELAQALNTLGQVRHGVADDAPRRGVETIVCRIDQDAPSAFEKYLGWVLKAPQPVSATGPVSDADVGQVPVDGDGDPINYNAFIINAQGRGQTTHSLTVGDPLVTDYVCYTFGQRNADAQLICYTNGVAFKDCVTVGGG